jgi:carbonic anhydrase
LQKEGSNVRVSKIFIILLFLVAVSGLVYAGAGEDSLSKLLDGNKRFVAGELAKKDLGEARRQELTKGQHPFATVLACSDSRVAPELIFDQGLGDIFIIRDAGNVVEPVTLGSIEYGVEHLHTPLLVILGHERCGAVTAALDERGEPGGNIGAILKKIMPAVETARKAGKERGETLDLAIQENVRNTYKNVMQSRVVSELVHEGKLRIIGAEYYLGTGKVEMVDLGSSAEGHNGHH